MKVDVITGASYGDEGKGKVVHLLCDMNGYDYIFRVNASTNASHTVVLENGDKLITKQLPSEFNNSTVQFVVSPNALLNLKELRAEIENRPDKKTLKDRLSIGSMIALIIPAYFEINKQSEVSTVYGSTNQCTGIAVIARAGRHCVRLLDVHKAVQSWDGMSALIDKLKFTCNQIVPNLFSDYSEVYWASMALDLVKDYMRIQEYVGDYCVDYGNFLYTLPKESTILIEGCNGILLDNVHGLNPYTTSSGTTTLSLLAGANISSVHLRSSYIVIGAYFCCLNKRPFPTEMNEADAKAVYALNSEVDNAEGMQRRVGYFDLPALKRALIGHDGAKLIVNKFDVLAALPDILMCVAYRDKDSGKIYTVAPEDTSLLDNLEPIYESYGAFKGELYLMDNMRKIHQFAKKIEDETGCMIASIGIGMKSTDFKSLKGVEALF